MQRQDEPYMPTGRKFSLYGDAVNGGKGALFHGAFWAVTGFVSCAAANRLMNRRAMTCEQCASPSHLFSREGKGVCRGRGLGCWHAGESRCSSARGSLACAAALGEPSARAAMPKRRLHQSPSMWELESP